MINDSFHWSAHVWNVHALLHPGLSTVFFFDSEPLTIKKKTIFAAQTYLKLHVSYEKKIQFFSQITKYYITVKIRKNSRCGKKLLSATRPVDHRLSRNHVTEFARTFQLYRPDSNLHEICKQE